MSKYHKALERKTSRFHMVMEPSLRRCLEDMAYSDRVDPSELVRQLIAAERDKRKAA